MQSFCFYLNTHKPHEAKPLKLKKRGPCSQSFLQTTNSILRHVIVYPCTDNMRNSVKPLLLCLELRNVNLNFGYLFPIALVHTWHLFFFTLSLKSWRLLIWQSLKWILMLNNFGNVSTFFSFQILHSCCLLFASLEFVICGNVCT